MINYESFLPWVLEKQNVALLIGGMFALVFWIRNVTKSWNTRLPPGPRGLPLIGNFHQMGEAMYRDFERLGETYGPLMYLKFGSVPVIVIQNAAYAREFTKVHDHVFANRPSGVLAGEVLFHKGHGITVEPVGEHWRYMRSIMTTEVLTPNRLMVFKADRLDLVFGAAKEMLAESKRGSPVQLKAHVIALFYNVVTKMIAGSTMYGTVSAHSEEQIKFRNMVKEFLAVIPLFIYKDWFPVAKILGGFQGAERRMRRAAKVMDQYAQAWLDNHRKAKANASSRRMDGQEPKKDFVDTLLEIKGRNDKPFTDINRKHITEAFLVGGTESSSTTMEWAIAELIKNPKLLKRVQDEIESVVGRDRPVTEDDLSEMKFLNAVIKETFRLHPTAAYLHPRQGSADCKVGGYDIPSNARIYINIWHIGRDEGSWENPLEFNPERFLDPKRPLPFSGSDHAFMPFGSGRRQCPGISLGLLLIPITLATFLHVFDFSLPHGKKPSDIDLDELPGMALPMKTPLEVFVTPRLAPQFYKTYFYGTQ